MRIVIVGATGNVGTALVRRLSRSADLDLVGVVRHPPQADPPYDGMDWRAVDIGRAGARTKLVEAFAGADAVVHLAWLLQPNHDEAVLRRTNVDGSRAVFEAAAEAGVGQLVVASSVGAYSPGPKTLRVDETWPTEGVRSSHYGRHKAAVERLLDDVEARHPDLVVTRMRPGLVMQGDVGLELDRLFIGPLVPTGWLRFLRLPLVPVPPTLVSQVVWADDLADAFERALRRRAAGAFNLAAEPVIGPRRLAEALHGAWWPTPAPVLRAGLALAWRLHLVRADPGWLDLATEIPLMSTRRARTELGWAPEVGAVDAVRAAAAGVGRHSRVEASPHLR